MADLFLYDGDSESQPNMAEPPSNIVRELIDTSELLLRNHEAVRSPTLDDSNFVMDCDDEEDQQETQDTIGFEGTQQSQQPGKSRKRFSYANKRFKATSDTYLNPTFEGSFREKFPTDLEMTGRVLVCPNKKNGQLYTVDWEIRDTDLNSKWLLTKLESTKQFKSKLQAMILDFKEEDGICSSAISRKKAPPQASRPTIVTDVAGNVAEPADDSPIARDVSHYGSKGTPPVEIRAGRYSALKTASGSQRSLLSSISGTQDSARSTLNTRSSDGGGYDSG
jgi:hypothetical protein